MPTPILFSCFFPIGCVFLSDRMQVGSTIATIRCGLVDLTQSVRTRDPQGAVRHGIGPVQPLGRVDALHHLPC
ncbi:unnamed protein product [Musa acuminata subsp. malaccensis]|uniref:(wild Malaysian banana) hypothetical protein n=1 Tax=Musa acuminata subsp. malaccensis TaxID=214687 RepID=A0A804J4L8_MUSAM|nr:unnamed protein product [Musa acuminata subsp. malaccensis]